MRFIYKISHLVIALAVTALIHPVMAEERQVIFDGHNVTVTEGSYNPADPKRSSPPTECNFRGGGVYSWKSFTLDKGTACIGWVNPRCKKDGFEEPHFTNIQKVLQEQVGKDGLFKSSVKGDWRASFIFPTSAFKNRDTAVFSWAMTGLVKGGWSKYFWSRDNDFAQVSYDGPTFASCP